jgi:phenylpyruvate tautomerase PptA (4-oxalocrotonate tautomerase family)
MPIYQCAHQHGLLTGDMKAKIATAITDAHVEATGAPRVFVHVFFNEIPPGIAYSAGEPDAEVTGITGSIRQGSRWVLAAWGSRETLGCGLLRVVTGRRC